jgi:hypothetical protein
LLCLPLLASASGAPLAGDSSDWDALSRLDSGTRVEVIHGNLQRTQGTLSLITADELTIQTESGLQTLPRADIRRVSVPAKSKKKRILMSMAIGAAAGAAVTYLGAESGDIDIRRDYVVGAGLAAGAAAGAGIGALTVGPKTIYRAR